MFTPPKHVTCHVSCFTCHMSHVMCHVSRVTCHIFFFWQSGEAYRWRVCYQRGLPCLVWLSIIFLQNLLLWFFLKNTLWQNGLIQVKEEGRTGFSNGWQGCSKGFPEGKAQKKSWGAALWAWGKPRPSRLFYLDFTFYLKLYILVNFLNFSSIDVLRSIMAAKLLEYFYRIIRVYIYSVALSLINT